MLDSGAQIGFINEKFINKDITQFQKVPILPINNTVIKISTNDTRTINRQAFISIMSQGVMLEVPVLVIKDLRYTDTLN